MASVIQTLQVASVDTSPPEEVVRFAKLREDGCLGEPLFIAFTSVSTSLLSSYHVYFAVLQLVSLRQTWR